jgi:hypothetical protein
MKRLFGDPKYIFKLITFTLIIDVWRNIMGKLLMILLILIMTIFCPFLGNAQSSSSIPIWDKSVSSKSFDIKMGELSSHECFLINVTSSTLIPWGLKIYKLLPNDMRNEVYSDECGGSFISWNPGEPKHINVSFPANEADEYDQGYYVLNIYTRDVALAHYVNIPIRPFIPTEWHVIIKKYSDKQLKSKSEQSPFENVSENTIGSPFENVSENTTGRSQQPTENGMVKVHRLQPIDSESEQSFIENAPENTTGRSQQPGENLTENGTKVEPSENFTENGTRIVLPLSRSSISVYRSVRLQSPSEKLTENGTKVEPSENFTENGTKVAIRLPHSRIRLQPPSENLTENGTKVKPVEVIDLANELL